MMKSISSPYVDSVEQEFLRLVLDIKQENLHIGLLNGRIRDTLDTLLKHLPEQEELQSVQASDYPEV